MNVEDKSGKPVKVQTTENIPNDDDFNIETNKEEKLSKDVEKSVSGIPTIFDSEWYSELNEKEILVKISQIMVQKKWKILMR